MILFVPRSVVVASLCGVCVTDQTGYWMPSLALVLSSSLLICRRSLIPVRITITSERGKKWDCSIFCDVFRLSVQCWYDTQWAQENLKARRGAFRSSTRRTTEPFTKYSTSQSFEYSFSLEREKSLICHSKEYTNLWSINIINNKQHERLGQSSFVPMGDRPGNTVPVKRDDAGGFQQYQQFWAIKTKTK